MDASRNNLYLVQVGLLRTITPKTDLPFPSRVRMEETNWDQVDHGALDSSCPEIWVAVVAALDNTGH